MKSTALKLVHGILLVCCWMTCQPQTSSLLKPLAGRFQIRGKLVNVSELPAWIYLSYTDKGHTFRDSTKVSHDGYLFSGKISEPVEATLQGSNAAGQSSFYVFLDVGTITLTSTIRFDSIQVHGSAAQLESDKLNEILKPIQDELRSTLQRYSTAVQHKQDSLALTLMDTLTELSRKTAILSGEFVKNNPASRLALNALELYSRIDLSNNIGNVEDIYYQLPGTYKTAYTGRLIAERIQNENKTKIGKRMPVITVSDSLGKKLTLPFHQDDYVLYDFWASWCRPCREENPNLTSAIQKYKGKKFSITGISIDKRSDRNKWLEAIQQDKLPWTQLIDHNTKKNSVSTILGIQSIPFNLLVNKEGVIVAKNLRGSEIDKTLAKFLQ